jgi:hypothetical protein
MSKQPRARKMEKDYAMVVDCMDMSVSCVHTRVGSTNVRQPNKRHPSSGQIKQKMQQRRPKLQQENAVDGMKRGIKLIGVPTSKTSIRQIGVTFAMLVEERDT